MSSWFYGSNTNSSASASRSSRQSGGAGTGRRVSRRHTEEVGNYGYGGRGGGAYESGGRYQQTQNYRQDTTQLEAQVVFVDQARTCLIVAETHLDNVANGAGSTVLSATASGMVACLNLMRMSALERSSDEDGLNAAKAMVKKFRGKCDVKYGLLPTAKQMKINQVRDAVCSHMMSVLNGEQSVPVLEVSSTMPSDEGGERGTVTRSMQEVLRGEHEVENLRNDVRGDADRYREELQEEAKNGASWEEGEEHRGRFDADTARRVLQGDMLNIAPLTGRREMERDAKQSLKRLVRRDEEILRESGSNVRVDKRGCPDLMSHEHANANEDAEMDDVSGSQKTGYGQRRW